MGTAKTVDRILDASEDLFSEKGFAETSLRVITTQAEVNLASVNYHFGSKEELIHATFERFLTPYCREIDISLERMKSQDKQPSLRDIMLVISGAAISIRGDQPERGIILLRLVSQAYYQGPPHLKKFISERYGTIFKKVLDSLSKAAPHGDPLQLFLRIHYAMGAGIFMISSVDSLRSLAKTDFATELSLEQMSEQFVEFVVNGIEGSSGDA